MQAKIDRLSPKLALGLMLAILILTACRGASSPSPLAAMNDDQRSRIEATLDTYEHPELPALLGDASPLAQRLLKHIPANLHMRIRHDPALDLVSHRFAYLGASESRLPPDGYAQWGLWRYGRSGQYYCVSYRSSKGRSLSTRLDQHLALRAEKLTDLLQKHPDGHFSFGVARVNYQLSRYAQAVLVVQNKLQLDPLAKYPQPGQPFTVSGRFLVRSDRYNAYFEGDDGAINKQRIHPDQDGRFSITLTAPTKPGHYPVGIWYREPVTGAEETPVSDARNWTRPALWLPIFIGIRELQKPTVAILRPRANPADPQEWIQRLLDSTNAVRQAKGLKPLTYDAEAAQLAQQQVEHPTCEVPFDPDLKTKLGCKAYQSTRSFDRLDEMLWMNRNRPGYLYNLLKPEVERIAFAVKPNENGGFHSVEYLLGPKIVDEDPEPEPANTPAAAPVAEPPE